MFAPQSQDPNSGPFRTKLTAMAFRFVARQFCSKPLALRNARPMVSFTFDDVPASACEIGARIIKQRGGRCTFYVAAAACRTMISGGPGHASIDQLRKVWANGHEIGCHTYSHTAVCSLSLDQLEAELSQNQAALKKINGNLVVTNFAYPYGDMSVRTKHYLETRFASCRSGHAGINSEVVDLGALHAWPLQNASLDRAKIADLIARTVQSRGWLIFYSHDVSERPSEFGISPDLLESAVCMAKQSGCILPTIAEGLELAAGTAGEKPLVVAAS